MRALKNCPLPICHLHWEVRWLFLLDVTGLSEGCSPTGAFKNWNVWDGNHQQICFPSPINWALKLQHPRGMLCIAEKQGACPKCGRDGFMTIGRTGMWSEPPACFDSTNHWALWAVCTWWKAVCAVWSWGVKYTLAARGYLHWDVFHWFSGIGGRLLLKILPTVSFVSFSSECKARLCLILHIIHGVLRVAGCQDFYCFNVSTFKRFQHLFSNALSPYVSCDPTAAHDTSVVMVWAQWERWNCRGSRSQPWNECAGIWGKELRRTRKTVTTNSGPFPSSFPTL